MRFGIKSGLFAIFGICAVIVIAVGVVIFVTANNGSSSSSSDDTTTTSPVVNTTKGLVRGEILTTRTSSNVQYYSFKGIPYAAPPVGDLRFQPPQEIESWSDVRDATEFGSHCAQVENTDNYIFLGEEDCLFLNIYTKDVTPEVLSPVMFWVHGGYLARGNSNMYGPDFLIEQDVVLVTINYRVNVLGFLSLGDENAYGNMGLKDQIFALTWVNENIDRFGGDPERITIFGESAGGHSSDYLTVTPLTQGLFKQVIVQSGSSVSIRGLQREPEKYTRNLLNYFGIESNDTSEIVESLRNIDYRELVTASFNFSLMGWTNFLTGFPFGPVVEANHSGAVVTRTGYQHYTRGEFNQMPFMTGYTTYEASTTLQLIESAGANVSLFDEDVQMYASISLNLEDDDTKTTVGEIVKNYFVGNNSYLENYTGFLQFLTFETYARPVRKTAELRRPYVNGYFYRFSYTTTSDSSYTYGAPHAGELRFIFYLQGVNYSSFTDEDNLIQQRMTKLWTNFAKTGNPTPDTDDPVLDGVVWPELNSTYFGFLDIGSDLTPGINPNASVFDFWDELFDIYGNSPYFTY